MSEKLYVPRSRAKERETPFGKVINVSFDAATLLEFIKAHTNSRGYFNITIVPRRKPDEHQTHSVVLDTWEPQNKEPLKEAHRAVERAIPTPPPEEDPPF